MSIYDLLDDLKTVSEAAKIAGYSVRHVRLLADTGRIAAKRYFVGQRSFWLVSMTSLLNYRQRQQLRRTG